MEAHAILNIVWLARTIQMVDVRLRQAQSLDYDLIDLVLHSFHGKRAVVCGYLLKDELEGPLASNVISILVIVLNERARLFIDRIVG